MAVRGLYVFSLPPQLLDALAVRSIQALAAPDAPEQQPEPRAAPAPAAALPSTSGIGCPTCPGASFDSIDEQRAHFKSDWHRYNVKAKLRGKVATVDEWEGIVEGVSSISGSESSASSSSSTSATRRVARALGRTALSDGSDEAAEYADRVRRAHLRTAVIWFSPTAPLDSLGFQPDTQFGVHRALFPTFERAGDYLGALRRLQLGEDAVARPGGDDEDGERRMTLLMVAGGHFAGMVVAVRPRGKSERQDVKGAGDVRILKHKTFHRYTTRKKQGGSQGLNDNTKSKAISAGAMLRRYGEQALRDEIRALLAEWADDVRASERVFLRASTHGKQSFWGYEDAVLDKNDERIRTFPFPTRRPTQQELLRCWHELTRLKISHLSEEALAAQDDAYIASLQPKRQATAKPAPAPATPAPAAPKLTPEEEAQLDRHRRLADMVRKNRVDALRPFWAKHAAALPAETGPESLALAASAGSEDAVRFFLDEGGVDPAAPVGSTGKRAYEHASSKAVRTVFRRAAAERPAQWDWAAARVPAGWTEEGEAEQGEKKAERRRGLRDKLRARDAAREEEEAREAEVEAAAVRERERADAERRAKEREGRTGPQKLGGKQEGLGGMTPEMRARIERERRARAAEARFGPA